MLKVYGCPNTRSLRVTWLLEELGLDYTYQFVNLKGGEQMSDAFTQKNPAARVPALETDHGVLSESGAIVSYLAALKPEAELIPTASAYRRAVYDQWLLFTLTELEQPLWTMGKHQFALPAEQRCPAVIPSAQWEFQRALKCLSTGLGDKTYMLGEHMSALDILVAHTLFWGMAFKQPIEHKNLTDYIGRMAVRPALNAAREREKLEAAM